MVQLTNRIFSKRVIDPKKQDQSWGDSIYTDFKDFKENSLKMCVEILVIRSNDEDGIALFLAENEL